MDDIKKTKVDVFLEFTDPFTGEKEDWNYSLSERDCGEIIREYLSLMTDDVEFKVEHGDEDLYVMLSYLTNHCSIDKADDVVQSIVDSYSPSEFKNHFPRVWEAAKEDFEIYCAEEDEARRGELEEESLKESLDEDSPAYRAGWACEVGFFSAGNRCTFDPYDGEIKEYLRDDNIEPTEENIKLYLKGVADGNNDVHNLFDGREYIYKRSDIEAFPAWKQKILKEFF